MQRVIKAEGGATNYWRVALIWVINKHFYALQVNRLLFYNSAFFLLFDIVTLLWFMFANNNKYVFILPKSFELFGGGGVLFLINFQQLCLKPLWLTNRFFQLFFKPFIPLRLVLKTLEPFDRPMDGQTDRCTDVRNFSPFYKTLFFFGAAALVFSTTWKQQRSRARKPLTIWCLWAAGSYFSFNICNSFLRICCLIDFN